MGGGDAGTVAAGLEIRRFGGTYGKAKRELSPKMVGVGAGALVTVVPVAGAVVLGVGAGVVVGGAEAGCIALVLEEIRFDHRAGEYGVYTGNVLLVGTVGSVVLAAKTELDRASAARVEAAQAATARQAIRHILSKGDGGTGGDGLSTLYRRRGRLENERIPHDPQPEGISR